MEVTKAEVTSYYQPNTDSAQIYGLTSMGETRKSLAARTKSVSSKTPNTQPSSVAKLNHTTKLVTADENNRSTSPYQITESRKPGTAHMRTRSSIGQSKGSIL